MSKTTECGGAPESAVESDPDSYGCPHYKRKCEFYVRPRIQFYSFQLLPRGSSIFRSVLFSLSMKVFPLSYLCLLLLRLFLSSLQLVLLALSLSPHGMRKRRKKVREDLVGERSESKN